MIKGLPKLSWYWDYQSYQDTGITKVSMIQGSPKLVGLQELAKLTWYSDYQGYHDIGITKVIMIQGLPKLSWYRDY